MQACAFAAAVIAASLVNFAWAAPDEKTLGRKSGYPVGTAGNWYLDESVRVGSFTHQAEIPGLFRAGKPHVLQASNNVMHLRTMERAPDYYWDVDQTRGLTVDDYLARQRIMGLLIVKDGVIQVERYQYERKPSDLFTSQSMAKSITALAIEDRRKNCNLAMRERTCPRMAGHAADVRPLRCTLTTKHEH